MATTLADLLDRIGQDASDSTNPTSNNSKRLIMYAQGLQHLQDLEAFQS